jgi:hypothetical protein
MKLQYLQDTNGNTTAVVVPIEEWNRLTEKNGGIGELPQWQKNIIDQRLDLIKNHPDDLVPLQEFLKELDTDGAF